MKTFHFGTIPCAVDAHPSYKPYMPKPGAPMEKIRSFDNITYFKLGTKVIQHDTLWKVGRFFKTIGLVLLFPALCFKDYRNLIKRSWKEFKSKEEKTGSIYVKKQLESMKNEAEMPPQHISNTDVAIPVEKVWLYNLVDVSYAAEKNPLQRFKKTEIPLNTLLDVYSYARNTGDKLRIAKTGYLIVNHFKEDSPSNNGALFAALTMEQRVQLFYVSSGYSHNSYALSQSIFNYERNQNEFAVFLRAIAENMDEKMLAQITFILEIKEVKGEQILPFYTTLNPAQRQMFEQLISGNQQYLLALREALAIQNCSE